MARDVILFPKESGDAAAECFFMPVCEDFMIAAGDVILFKSQFSLSPPGNRGAYPKQRGIWGVRFWGTIVG